MDMPATARGVSVRPLASMPVKFPEVAEALKDNGVGVQQGQWIMVTRIRVKGDHIEFHLGGGGFGTFSNGLAIARWD